MNFDYRPEEPKNERPQLPGPETNFLSDLK